VVISYNKKKERDMKGVETKKLKVKFYWGSKKDAQSSMKFRKNIINNRICN